MDRKTFLRLAVVGTASLGLAACRKAAHFTCTEAPGLDAEQAAARVTLGYSDLAADEARSCLSCNHYTVAAEGSCGSCRLVRGPIHPAGTCRVWVARS